MALLFKAIYRCNAIHIKFSLLEKGMAIHSNIFAWRIPWTEEPGGLQSTGLRRVGHNWATNTTTTTLIKLTDIFHRTRINNPKFIWNHKRPRIAQAILREKRQSRRHNPPTLQAILQNYSNQNSVLLGQKQTYRSMEQNRGPRIKPHSYGQLIFNTVGNNIKLKKWKWSHSVMSDSLRPHGLKPTTFLSPWDFPGKSTGMGCHCLLQEIFLTQGLNLGLPHCRQMLLPSEPPGKLGKYFQQIVLEKLESWI